MTKVTEPAQARKLTKRKPDGRDGRAEWWRVTQSAQSIRKSRKAIQREKTMKEWPRAWKVNLIERENPHWEGVRPPAIKAVR